MAVLGSKGSGKTVFLTSLANHLLNHDPARCPLNGWTVTPVEGDLAAGADADAFRLAATAAGVVDKILRDKLFEIARLRSSDADFWRREAARRFEATARSRPADELAPRLFLLAIQRAQESENAALKNEVETTSASETSVETAPSSVATLRRDFLTLFPTAENRGAFANESARLALNAGKLDDAAFYVDAVSPDDSVFSETLPPEK